MRIGEALPHWEAAVYLLDPGRLNEAAHTLNLTHGLLMTVLVLAIGVGGWLIFADVQRHLTMARQKTHFVSNVSHELKTPLTSIRMFAELLAEDRVIERSYLSVISTQAARLTGLINNVLDFASLERGEKYYRLTRCDLRTLVEHTVEAYRPHLEGSGFVVVCELPAEAVFVRGDGDALAQVMVNLFSNAEKYSEGRKEVAVKLCSTAVTAVLEVKDRGCGLRSGARKKIFEQFFRAHDLLADGTRGSRLGLTLARQIARAHGGDVTYHAREGGGSCFTLDLPLTAPVEK